MKTETTKPEPPTLSNAERIAADLIQPHDGDHAPGRARQRAMRALDHALAQKREANEIFKNLLGELSGEAPSQTAIAKMQAEATELDAEEARLLDALAAEGVSIVATGQQGIESMRELGEINPQKAWFESKQGREVLNRNSLINRALSAAGHPNRKAPEHVEKVVKSMSVGRSEAHRAFASKIEEVSKALGLARPEAVRKARESFPDLHAAALKEPIVMPASGVVSKAMIEIQKSKGASRSKLEQAAVYLSAALPWSDRTHRIAKEAASLTLEELLAAIALLTPEQAAQVRAVLDEPGTARMIEKYRPCGSNPDAMCRVHD